MFLESPTSDTAMGVSDGVVRYGVELTRQANKATTTRNGGTSASCDCSGGCARVCNS